MLIQGYKEFSVLKETAKGPFWLFQNVGHNDLGVSQNGALGTQGLKSQHKAF